MNEEISSVAAALQKKANQLSYASEILFAKTRDWQMIREYMCNRINDFDLTPMQREKMKRYQFVYNQLISGKYTDSEVVHQVMKQFDVGQTQAYEDLNCSREVFNAVININKQFELKLELESAKDMKRKCTELGDFKNASVIQKNIIKLIEMMPEIEDNSAEMFTGHTIEPVYDPALLGAPQVDLKPVLDAINAKRKVKIKTELFETLEYVDNKETL